MGGCGRTSYLNQICPISSLGRGEDSFCVIKISLILKKIQNDQYRAFEKLFTFVSLEGFIYQCILPLLNYISCNYNLHYVIITTYAMS